MLNALAQCLAAELAASGFTTDPLCGKLVAARMADRGEWEFQCLCQESASLASFPAMCIHHLGVGASFTEFLICGLPLDRALKCELATLGGIAHAIFAVFDALLDVSGCVPVLFGDNPQLSADSETSGKQQLVLDLVALYFRKLDSFPATTPPVRRLLEQAIQRLYKAELKTAAPNALRWSTWWRKNALPIVIMGLPAWLHMRDSDQSDFAQHLMWLGRVGEFLGWLDDASDYERDAAAGSANWLRLHHESIDDCARRIAAKGRRVLNFWDSRNADSPVRDTFTFLAWNWLSAT
jgi:hypothetical protein